MIFRANIITSLLLLILVGGCQTGAEITSQTGGQEGAYSMAVKKDEPASFPRVLIIGDSISMGYTEPVKEKLAGIADVQRIPVNGGPTIRGLEHIDEWLGDQEWDVIHFNWGLHDLKFMEDGKHQVPIDEYEKNLETLVERMKKTGATLIWCSTTPVPEGELRPPRQPEDAVEYNKVAERIMKKHYIRINDLYSFAYAQLSEIQRPENVHFTEKGSEILAGKVAESIRGVIAER